MSAFSSLPPLYVPEKYRKGPYNVTFSREAIEADYELIRNVYGRLLKRGWWHGEFSRACFKHFCQRGLQDPRLQQTILLAADGMFLGYIRARHNQDRNKVTLEEFVVPPTLTGLDLIGVLCERVAMRAQQTGAAQLFTKAGRVAGKDGKEPTISLFKKFGFELIGIERPPEEAPTKRTPMCLFRKALVDNPPDPTYRPSCYTRPHHRGDMSKKPERIPYRFIPAAELAFT